MSLIIIVDKDYGIKGGYINLTRDYTSSNTNLLRLAHLHWLKRDWRIYGIRLYQSISRCLWTGTNYSSKVCLEHYLIPLNWILSSQRITLPIVFQARNSPALWVWMPKCNVSTMHSAFYENIVRRNFSFVIFDDDSVMYLMLYFYSSCHH